jgi:phage terminase large subunit
MPTIKTKIRINDVYEPHLENYARTQIYYGGSSSGKSWFLAQRCILDILAGGRNYLVCRQVARTLRGSVFQQIEREIREADLLPYFTINKSDAVITCNVNGYQILFAGLDDVEKIKSLVPAKGVITDIWIEEATETERGDVKDLYKRQRGGDEATKKRMILSFNPILQSHWIYKEFFESAAWSDEQKQYNDGELSILKTTYKDNRYLTTQDTHDLENESDKYRYNVYTLGNWGILGHVIFTNWRVADLNNPDDPYYLPEAQRTNHRNGGDFGFSIDPSAVWQAHYDKPHKRIYVFGELYQKGLTNDLLAIEVKKMIGSQPIIWDSAEPKSIAELQQYGVSASGAMKGKDSVLFGYQWLQQQEIIIDKNCVNTKMEISTAHWLEDAGGNALLKPSGVNDHLIAAGRYAHEQDMFETWTSF